MKRNLLIGISIIFIILFISIFVFSCFAGEVEVLVRENGEVIFQKGDWKEVQHKISPQKVFFTVDADAVYEFKNTSKKLYRVKARIDNFKGKGSNSTCVYDNNGNLGCFIYYCPEDKGIYVEAIEDVHVTEYLRSGGVKKYYRIADGKIENGLFKVFLPEGTWFSYRYAAPFSWGKDSNWLTIHIPKNHEGISKDYFK